MSKRVYDENDTDLNLPIKVLDLAGPHGREQPHRRRSRARRSWVGKRLTDGETTLRADGHKISAYAAFEHAHIYWKSGASARQSPSRTPTRRYRASGCSRRGGRTTASRSAPRFPVLAHSVVTNGAVQAFEHGVLFRKTGSRAAGRCGSASTPRILLGSSKARSAGRSAVRAPCRALTTSVSASSTECWCSRPRA